MGPGLRRRTGGVMRGRPQRGRPTAAPSSNLVTILGYARAAWILAGARAEMGPFGTRGGTVTFGAGAAYRKPHSGGSRAGLSVARGGATGPCRDPASRLERRGG